MPDATSATHHLATAVAVGVPLLVGVVMASARWNGGSPFGSDNDEYRLLSDSLSNGSIEIAGVEATKYPVGYSSLLAIADRIGLPPTGTALAINLVLVAVLATLVWRLAARSGGIVPASVAATVTVLSLGLWDSVYVTMPDLAFLVVATVVLSLTDREPDQRRLIALLTLVALSAMLKSVGLILGLAVAGWLASLPRWRRWCWTPAVIGVGLAGLQAAWTSTAPEHTTGYNRTFWLFDPYDASLGRIGILDLPSRMWNQRGGFITDVGEAVFGSQHASVWLGLGALVLIAIGAAALRDRLAFSASFFIVYTLFLLAWPYSSARFGLAFLPWAAVGAASVVQSLARRTNTVAALAIALLVLLPYGLDARFEAADTAARESAQIARLESAVDDVDTWLTEHAQPGDLVSSPDYRELAYRTDRIYLPIPYTSDTDELWRVTAEAGARWIVILEGIYPSREKVVTELVASRPDRIVLAHQNASATIYQIRGSPR